MKRSIAAILVCLLVFACAFTGCSKAKGLKVLDGSGKERVLVTNDSGEPVYDDAGNVMVVETDSNGNAKKENGEQVTNAVALNEVLVSGKKIFSRWFTLEKPSGYDLITYGSTVSLTKDNENITLTFDMDGVEKRLGDMNKLVNAINDQDAKAEVKTENKKLCGEDAVIAHINVVSDDQQNKISIVYALFEKNGITYAATLNTNSLDADTSEFESIINSISFR